MPHYDPYNFVSNKSLGYLLRINHSQMQTCAERILAEHDFSFVLWIALMKLSEGSAMTAGDLCKKMMHDNGAITRVLDQLEERGFIARHRSTQDRRVVDLTITELGQQKLNLLTPLVIGRFNDAIEPLSSDEFSELTRLLEKLHGCLQQHSAELLSESSSSPASTPSSSSDPL